MLTLIKRELRNQMNLLMLLIPAMLLYLIIVGMIVYPRFEKGHLDIGMWLCGYSFVLMILPIIFGVFGAIISYRECNNKTVTFLQTLATTRGRIFLARCIGGVVSSLVILLMFIGCYLAFRLILPFSPFLFELFLGRYAFILFLMMLAGYSLGLMAGHSNGRNTTAVCASIILSLILVNLILVKGFSVQAVLILAGVTIIAGVIAWQRFERMSL